VLLEQWQGLVTETPKVLPAARGQMSCLQGNDFPLGIRSWALAQQIQIVSSLIFCVVLLFSSIRRFTNEGAQRLNKAIPAEFLLRSGDNAEGLLGKAH